MYSSMGDTSCGIHLHAVECTSRAHHHGFTQFCTLDASTCNIAAVIHICCLTGADQLACRPAVYTINSNLAQASTLTLLPRQPNAIRAMHSHSCKPAAYWPACCCCRFCTNSTPFWMLPASSGSMVS
eukprot:GHRQ01039200.1.p1 GENE.GHRQ01039200.1~~GHRQ01039200.1.p1  ORF type:complete len:127 (+),score=15.35 GHRQ01039200.1:237-617(+)